MSLISEYFGESYVDAPVMFDYIINNPKAITTHSIIHRQILLGCLNDTLQMDIRVVNVIKRSAINKRRFRNNYTEIMRPMAIER